MIKKLKKYFIPHEGNDHKPHILRPKAVALVCLVVVAVESVFIFGTSYLAPRSQLFGIIVVNALIDGTNAARTANDLPALHESPLLDAAAQEKANDMVANNYFAHTSPSGVTPWYWFVNVGYNFASAGENLAVNFADSSDVTTAWLNSPEHRENILDASFEDIGMATAQGTYDGQPAVYVVELFGTPAASSAFVPTAEAATPPPQVAPAVTPPPSPAPAPTPAPAVVAVKPTPAPAAVPTPEVVTSIPTVIASDSAATPSGQQSFIAVKGTQVQPVTAAQTPAPSPSPEANLIQTAAADPRQTVDYFFFAIAILFAVALLMNVFVKFRIQYPRLIMSGILVVVVAGLFIVANQHFGLASVAVL